MPSMVLFNLTRSLDNAHRAVVTSSAISNSQVCKKKKQYTAKLLEHALLTRTIWLGLNFTADSVILGYDPAGNAIASHGEKQQVVT